MLHVISVKKARDTRTLLLFLDESGFSERPSVRRTWASRGQTPIVVAPFNWKRLAAIASGLSTLEGSVAEFGRIPFCSYPTELLQVPLPIIGTVTQH